MFNCLFCGRLLNQNEKAEHVVPNALGGRLTTRTVVCSRCNEKFGNSIDRENAEQVKPIRNMLNIQSGDGKSPPALRRIQTGIGLVNLESDGSISRESAPFSISRNGDDAFNIDLKVSSFAHMRKQIPHIAKKLQTSEDDVINALVHAGLLRIGSRSDAVLQISFGTEGQLRSLAKSCIVLWFRHYRRNLDQSSFTGPIVSWIAGSGESKGFAEIDTRPLPNQQKIEEKHGKFFHACIVSTNKDGNMVGYFRLYNQTAWRFNISSSGTPKGQYVCLFINTENPKQFELEHGKYNQEFHKWLAEPILDIDNVNTSMARTGHRARLKAGELLIAEAVNETARIFKLQPDQPIHETEIHEFTKVMNELILFSLFPGAGPLRLSEAHLKRLLKPDPLA